MALIYSYFSPTDLLATSEPLAATKVPSKEGI